MTSFRVERLRFTRDEIRVWSDRDPQHKNWPAVYTLDNNSEIYVGESINVAARMRQHLTKADKAQLTSLKVVLDTTFNKSAALDLESFLIRLLAGDGKYAVLNRNEGITDSDYYDRATYRSTFDAIFDELARDGVFTRPIQQIINDDLFKLSPFKALNGEQSLAVEWILEGLFEDIGTGATSTGVIEGAPGTGKTVVAIYLMKLLRDIATTDDDEVAGDSLFSDFFTEGYREQVRDLRIGLVVPQQSLRASIKKVFRRTPGLDPAMVLTPFEVGADDASYDLLVVDEAHRLNQRANQASGVLNAKFATITTSLFGTDDASRTQLDWIRAKSHHQLFLLDAAQSVRPADLPTQAVDQLVATSRKEKRHYHLVSQMRVSAGQDYVDYVRRLLGPTPPEPQTFEPYRLAMFDDLGAMHDVLRAHDEEEGLARLVAGYAWPWASKNDPSAVDISVDGCDLRWNQTATDWITSPGAVDEVGSIHTVQGYDLNYAGVIIGPDLWFDTTEHRIRVDRASYHDAKGKENNPRLGIVYTDDDLLRFVSNIYGVLLTRGILGTYLYVCDPGLRDHLSRFVPPWTAS